MWNPDSLHSLLNVLYNAKCDGIRDRGWNSGNMFLATHEPLGVAVHILDIQEKINALVPTFPVHIWSIGSFCRTHVCHSNTAKSCNWVHLRHFNNQSHLSVFSSEVLSSKAKNSKDFLHSILQPVNPNRNWTRR